WIPSCSSMMKSSWVSFCSSRRSPIGSSSPYSDISYLPLVSNEQWKSEKVSFTRRLTLCGIVPSDRTTRSPSAREYVAPSMILLDLGVEQESTNSIQYCSNSASLSVELGDSLWFSSEGWSSCSMFLATLAFLDGRFLLVLAGFSPSSGPSWTGDLLGSSRSSGQLDPFMETPISEGDAGAERERLFTISVNSEICSCSWLSFLDPVGSRTLAR